MRRDASTWKAIYDMRRCSKQTDHEDEKKKKEKSKKKNNKRKIDCHVMHLKNPTKSKRESRKKKEC